VGRVAFWVAALLWAYCLTAHALVTAGWSPPVLHPLLVGGLGAAISWTTYLSYQSWPATVWPPPTPPSAVPRDLHEQARVKVAPPPAAVRRRPRRAVVRRDDVAGPVWLWERSVAESKLHRPSTRTHLATEYKPSTWGWTIQNLFREFNAGLSKKDRLRPHDLRARAITLVAAATQNVDATAQAMGVDPQTARHYLDAGKAFDRMGIMKRAASLLLPDDERPDLPKE